MSASRVLTGLPLWMARATGRVASGSKNAGRPATSPSASPADGSIPCATQHIQWRGLDISASRIAGSRMPALQQLARQHAENGRTRILSTKSERLMRLLP